MFSALSLNMDKFQYRLDITSDLDNEAYDLRVHFYNKYGVYPESLNNISLLVVVAENVTLKGSGGSAGERRSISNNTYRSVTLPSGAIDCYQYDVPADPDDILSSDSIEIGDGLNSDCELHVILESGSHIQGGGGGGGAGGQANGIGSPNYEYLDGGKGQNGAPAIRAKCPVYVYGSGTIECGYAGGGGSGVEYAASGVTNGLGNQALRLLGNGGGGGHPHGSGNGRQHYGYVPPPNDYGSGNEGYDADDTNAGAARTHGWAITPGTDEISATLDSGKGGERGSPADDGEVNSSQTKSYETDSGLAGTDGYAVDSNGTGATIHTGTTSYGGTN